MTMTEPRAETPLLHMVTCNNLLNIYLRESRLLYAHGLLVHLSECEQTAFVDEEGKSGSSRVKIELPLTGGFLIGTLEAYSPSGHHLFGSELWHSTGNGSFSQICSASELAKLLIAELVHTSPATHELAILLDAVENSLSKTALYLDAVQHPANAKPKREEAQRFITTEQALVFGHPFHPTPKSSEGFSSADLALYAPELGASFTLEYVAVDPVWILEDGLQDDVIPADVRTAAAAMLGSERDHWKLLPCHPWQARYLQDQASVQAMIANQQLVFLGPLGETVYPTSSVRTVVLPQHQAFFKLPLNVRITNFTRINPVEHLRRSLDASRAIALASDILPNTGFKLLQELGYRTVCPPTADGEALSGSFAVLFREKPFAIDGHAPLVLAGLFEPCPISGTPLLLEYLRKAAHPNQLDTAMVLRWVRRYLQIGLLPILELFLKRGISLEAHVQNTLLAFKDGWPATVYVRDLEGVSISRELAMQGGWYDHILNPNSPALYPEADAWHRLKYYVIVNQLSHLLATIAHCTATPEALLWETARRWLLEQPSLINDTRSRRYLIDLLEAPTLPAKANLISRFQGRSEAPVYVPIANPFVK